MPTTPPDSTTAAKRAPCPHAVTGIAPRRPDPATLPSLVFLVPGSPFRPPAWRWLLAIWLRLGGTKRQRRRSDFATRRLVAFLNALCHRTGRRHEARVAHRWPAIYSAYQLT